jgi:hypothetical protein
LIDPAKTTSFKELGQKCLCQSGGRLAGKERGPPGRRGSDG